MRHKALVVVVLWCALAALPAHAQGATSVTVAPWPAAPQPPGTAVSFSAQAAGGSGSYEYRFYRYVNGGWVVVQEYGPSNTWVWSSAGEPQGTHYFTVYARNVGSSALREAERWFSYTLAAPVAEVALAASPAGPQPAGPIVTLTAAASGGSGSYEYRFYQYVNGAWSVVRDYSAAATWEWNTAGAAPGEHYFTVHARNAGSTAGYEAAKFLAYTVAAPVSGVTLAPSPQAPQPAGTKVTFTAQASGGSGSYEYRFYRYVNGTWTVVRDYAAGATWEWDSAGAADGQHYFTVYARNAGSTAPYETTAFLGYTVAPPAASVAVTPSPPSPQSPGPAISFTAQAAGGSGSYEYRFYRYENGAWVIVQPYSPSNTWQWDTASLAPGTYYFTVYARNAGSAAGSEATKFFSYTLAPPVSGVSLTPSLPAPQPPGTAVTFTAQATGGTGSYEYRFFHYVNGAWQVVQDYSTTSTWQWNSEGASLGEHYFTVHARNAGSVASSQAETFRAFLLANPASSVAVVANAPSPQPVGTPVRLTAAASGGSGTYEYRFYKYVGGAWVMVQDYSTAASWTWNTSTESSGEHYFTVYARNAGSTAAVEAKTWVAFTMTPALQVSLTAEPPCPQRGGATVMFTAAVANAATLYEYQFWRYTAAGWSLVQDYSTAATLPWDTRSAASGEHYFAVFVRSQGSTAAYQGSGFTTCGLDWRPQWRRVLANAPWVPRDSAAAAVFDNKMWILGGYTPEVLGDVWTSPDGISWTKTGDVPEPVNLSPVGVLANALAVQATSGATYASQDGSSWQLLSALPSVGYRVGAGSATFDNRWWIFGGISNRAVRNDVWSSSNGVVWRQDAPAAPWTAREWFGNAVTGSGKLWAFGGGNASFYDNFIAYQDVWNTVDGVNWTRVLEQAPWPGRWWSVGAYFRNRLWLLGGYQSQPEARNLNDVWYSKDGTTWEQYEARETWSPRHAPSVLVFNNKLWMLGGNAHPLMNDVWELDIPGLTFLSEPVLRGTVGVEYRYQAKADFNDSLLPVTYRATTSPAWLAVDAATGLLTGTPGSAGEYEVVLEASDGTGALATQSFVITVE